MLLLSTAVCCSATRWPLTKTKKNRHSVLHTGGKNTHTNTKRTVVLFLSIRSTDPTLRPSLLHATLKFFMAALMLMLGKKQTRPRGCPTWKRGAFFSPNQDGHCESGRPRVANRRQLSYLLTVQLPSELQRNLFSSAPKKLSFSLSLQWPHFKTRG